MILKPAVLQGTLQNSQNVTNIKHDQDAKPMVDQSHIVANNEKQLAKKMENVVKRDDVENGNEKYDAKEKGKGEYYSVRVKKKGADSKEEVRVKDNFASPGEGGFFDMKI